MPVNIKLLKIHRHGGRTLQPGAVIRVTETQAEWLIGNKVAEAANSPAAVAEKAGPATAKKAASKET